MFLIDGFPYMEYGRVIFGIVVRASTGLFPQNRDLTVIFHMSAPQIMITGLWYTKLLPVARYISHTSRVLAAKNCEVESVSVKKTSSMKLSRILVECTQTGPRNCAGFVSFTQNLFFSISCVRNQVANIHRHWKMVTHKADPKWFLVHERDTACNYYSRNIFEKTSKN